MLFQNLSVAENLVARLGIPDIAIRIGLLRLKKIAELAGLDRFATAAALAAATYVPGQPYLFVASGLNFPDGLAGAALGGPILFMPTVAPVPFAVLYEIGPLGAHQLVVFGGNGSLSDSAVAAAGYAFEVAPTASPSPSPSPTPSPSPIPTPTPPPISP